MLCAMDLRSSGWPIPGLQPADGHTASEPFLNESLWLMGSWLLSKKCPTKPGHMPEEIENNRK